MNHLTKWTVTLLFAAAAATFTGCSSTKHSEHGHGEHHTPPADKSHGTLVAVPDKAADILRETEKHLQQLGTAIQKRDARAAHQHDDAIKALVGAISARASSETKANVETLARDIANAARGAHRSAHDDKWDEAAGHVKHGQASLAELRAGFKEKAH